MACLRDLGSGRGSARASHLPRSRRRSSSAGCCAPPVRSPRVHVPEVAQRLRTPPVGGYDEPVVLEQHLRRVLRREVAAPALDVDMRRDAALRIRPGPYGFDAESPFPIGRQPAVDSHLLRARFRVEPVGARLVGVDSDAGGRRRAVGPVDSPLHHKRRPPFLGGASLIVEAVPAQGPARKSDPCKPAAESRSSRRVMPTQTRARVIRTEAACAA